MSEHDGSGDGAGSGRGSKGFVRDVMRRIAPTGPRGGEPDPERESFDLNRDDVEQLQDAVRLFGSDSTEFRRRLDRLELPAGRPGG